MSSNESKEQDMDMRERAALRAAAEAATPGPWILTPGSEHQVEDHDPVWQDFEIRAADMPEWDGVLSWDPFSENTTARPEDVAFLAHLGPDRILALLDQLDAAEAALARVKALHERGEAYGGKLDFCKKCVDLEGAWWPCATIRAIRCDEETTS